MTVKEDCKLKYYLANYINFDTMMYRDIVPVKVEDKKWYWKHGTYENWIGFNEIIQEGLNKSYQDYLDKILLGDLND